MRYVSSGVHPRDRRPGVVLLVVMAMLALFASLALSFVFYADAEAISSNLNMGSMVRSSADMDAEAAMGYFFSQFLYPTENTNSALRGHELARGVYGNNPASLNITPFNSNDRQTALSNLDPDLGVDQATLVNTQLYYDPFAPAANRTVNFARTPEFFDKYYFGSAVTPPQPSWNVAAKLKPATYHYVGGSNPGWTTTEDSNSIWLAKVDPFGTVVYPSFYRPWMASSIIPGSAAAKYQSVRPDMRWNFVPLLSPTGTPVVGPQVDPITGASYVGVMPNPADSRNVKVVLSYINSANNYFYTSFVNPDSEGLPPVVNGVMTVTSPSQFFGPDVKNLEYGPGANIPNLGSFNNDSYWIDMGHPVMTAPNGKRYKAMVSPLVMDLSNRVDLGVAGNRLGNQTVAPSAVYPNRMVNSGANYGKSLNPATDPYPLPSHVSGLGVGPTEINPNRLLAMRIFSVTEKAAVATIATVVPHGLAVGDTVAISGVGTVVPTAGFTAAIAEGAAAYNGVYQVSKIVNPNSFSYNLAVVGLPTLPAAAPVVLPSPGGAVFSMKKLVEMQLLLDRRYGGTFYGTPAQWAAAPQRLLANWTYGGVQTPKIYTKAIPTGSSLNFPAGNQYNPLDTDGVNITANTQNARPFGVSTAPPYVGFTMTSKNAITALPIAQKMTVDVTTLPTYGVNVGAGIVNVPYFPLTPGMALAVGDGAATETAPTPLPGGNPKNTPVIVETVDSTTNPPSFTAVFRSNHPAGSPITTVGATRSTAAINPLLILQKKAQTMNVGQTTFTLPNGMQTSLQPGMNINVGRGTAAAESVVIAQVTAAPATITAYFTIAHPPGTLIDFTPNTIMPNFPGTESIITNPTSPFAATSYINTGYGNGGSGVSATSPLSIYGYGTAGETLNSPLGYNPSKPAGLNTYPIPSTVDAVLRFGGTNGPATLAELFRVMPNTFSDLPTRNKVSTASGHLDRIGSVPMFNFNTKLKAWNPWVQNAAPGKSSAGQYVMQPSGSFPLIASVISSITSTPFGVGSLVSVTTMKPHNVVVGQKVAIKGVVQLSNGSMVPSSFNGTYTVTQVPAIPVDATTQQPVTFQFISPTNMGAVTSNNGYVLAVPDPTKPATEGVIANSDYISNTDWRSNVSQVLRVDLNRKLTDYPAPVRLPTATVGQIPTNVEGYNQALQDRQNLARDIYRALVRITGAQDPNVHANMTKQLPEYQAARWLAQLAVNIVDFIDNDDYITPFPWVTLNPSTFLNPNGVPYETWSGVQGAGGQPTDWVFGTELPRLVVNEIYASQDSTNALSVWAELHNPFNATSALMGNGYPRDGGNAYLYNDSTTSPIYQFNIANATQTSPALNDPGNSLGVAPTTYKIIFPGVPTKGHFSLIYGGKPTANINYVPPYGPPMTLDQRVFATLQPIINAYNGVDYMDASYPKTGVTGVSQSGVAPAVPTITVTYYSSPGTKLTLGVTTLKDAKGNLITPLVSPQPNPIASVLTVGGAGGSAVTATNIGVFPANGAASDPLMQNYGYAVFAPAVLPALDPKIPQSTNLAIAAGFKSPSMTTQNIPQGQSVTYMLQRLANQHLPAQPNPLGLNYNPYVTVDYLDQMQPIITSMNGLTATSAGGAATVTTPTAHNFQIGDWVTISNMLPALPAPGYNITAQITGMNATKTTFTYKVAGAPAAGSGGSVNLLTVNNRQSTGRLQPFSAAAASLQAQIPYVYNVGNATIPTILLQPKTPVPPTLPGLVNNGVTVTAHTQVPHGFVVGQTIKIINASDYQYNGLWKITAVPVVPAPLQGTQFQFKAVASLPIGTSGGGTVTTAPVPTVINPNPNQPFNTFYGRNNPVNTPIDWITHLDRPPVNIAELLHVSANKPFQLTQKFRDSSALQQYAPWTPYPQQALRQQQFGAATQWLGGSNFVTVTTTAVHGYSIGQTVSLTNMIPAVFNGNVTITNITSPTTFTYSTSKNGAAPITGAGTVALASTANFQNALLYRALDLFSTPSHMNGAMAGSRLLGRPNLNTLMDDGPTPSSLHSSDVLQAIADSQDVYLPASGRQMNPWFTQTDVDAVASSIVSPALVPIPMSAPNAVPPGAQESGNTVTINFAQPHGFSTGQIVTIGLNPNGSGANVVDIKGNPIPQYSGMYQITSVPTALSFTVTNANPALASGGNGTVTPIRSTYKGFAAGNFSESLFQQTNSILNSTPLFQPNSASASGKSIYVQNSLLQKIHSNTSTTSNAFAIFATIGFFEVVDETVRPPRLGAEIGRSQNANIRHRFFAVVDRSGMQVFNAPSVVAAVPVKGTTKAWTKFETYQATLNPATGPDVVTYQGANYICFANNPPPLPPPVNAKFWQPVSMTYNVNAIQNPLSGSVSAWSATQNYLPSSVVTAGGLPYICIQPNYNKAPAANPADWQLAFQAGMLLEIVDPNPANSEVVQVTSITGNTFKANFVNDHLQPVTIICRGNPGAQLNYNPHKDSNVVLHLSVIK